MADLSFIRLVGIDLGCRHHRRLVTPHTDRGLGRFVVVVGVSGCIVTVAGIILIPVPPTVEPAAQDGLPKGSLGMLARLAMPRRVRLELGEG